MAVKCTVPDHRIHDCLKILKINGSTSCNISTQGGITNHHHNHYYF
ncbi:hypothetical protein DERF_005703 [Dermatophagoides farinae]|uniref:Uncharacterized protein n=1 Tax=Dermatophagoides farinae TaxID=6954 RepID=A0A922LBJ1_DERFA|nr:hypothetical protein DERF_005703 [Dermatophagoides farinae]